MEFSRQEFWSGVPFLPPGDLPDSGIELASPASSALTDGFFTAEPSGKPVIHSPCCLVTKSGPTLCDPLDYSPPGSSVHGTSQTRILE